jgi:hypothetical protein
MTAWFDYQTLLFGLFSATYSSGSSVIVQCEKCEHQNNVTFRPQSLIKTRNKETFDQVKQVLETVETFDDLKKYSILFKIFKYMLPNEKTIVEIKIPSLEVYLKYTKEIESSKKRKSVIKYLMFIKNIFVFDKETSLKIKKPSYLKLEKREQIENFLVNTNDLDLEYLEKKIDKDLDIYGVTYSLSNIRCSKCGHIHTKVNFDIEDLLFSRLIGN